MPGSGNACVDLLLCPVAGVDESLGDVVAGHGDHIEEVGRDDLHAVVVVGRVVRLRLFTGQDAEIASVKLIQDGIQFSTIFKDTRLLAEQAVIAAQALLAGEEPEANNTTDYDNGVKVVPSYLLDVVTVTQDNITEALVDTGYLTQEEIDAGVA